MIEVLYSVGAVVGVFVTCIAFEALAKFQAIIAYVSPKGEGYVNPSFSLRLSWRHLAVLPVATFLGLEGRGYNLPYWCAVVFGCFFVTWMGCFFWYVGREISRRRIANRVQTNEPHNKSLNTNAPKDGAPVS